MLAVYLENGVVTTRQIPLPHRPQGFALLRLLLGGICNTDLELQRGYYEFAGIPGHEFVAEVVEADTPSLTGKRVVGEINLACAHCEWCRKGLGRHCPNRTVLGIVKHPGALAEFLTLPERNLHVLPADIPLERAVFTEPLAAACEILDQVSIPPGDTVPCWATASSACWLPWCSTPTAPRSTCSAATRSSCGSPPPPG